MPKWLTRIIQESLKFDHGEELWSSTASTRWSSWMNLHKELRNQVEEHLKIASMLQKLKDL